MGRYILRRIASMALVILAVSALTFVIFQTIPNSDPARRLAGPGASSETIASVRRSWGFEKPIYEQYAITIGKILDGSVISYTQRVNVESEIARDLPATLSLSIGAAIIWLLGGIALGVLSVIGAGRFGDRVLAVLALGGLSTPAFVLGAVLLYLFAVKLPILPDTGYVPLTEDPWQWFTHLILPWLTLSTLFAGFYGRVLRANMLETLNEDFVRTARAKGISERRVLIHHVLRNSLAPILSLWALDFASVIGGGAILTEKVFDLHGVGQYAADSVAYLDVPPVLVVTMFTACFVVALNAIVDVIHAALFPSTRAGA